MLRSRSSVAVICVLASVVSADRATRAGAQDHADRVLARDKVQRRRWRLDVPLRGQIAGTVDLAATIAVDLDRLDFTGGKAHRVRALELDPVRGRGRLSIWG